MSLCFALIRFSLKFVCEAVESVPARIAKKTTVRCAKLYQKQRSDKIFLINNKLKEIIISLHSGGDPFPGVYMREIPALLKEGYRMTCPKFVSPKLYVHACVQ